MRVEYDHYSKQCPSYPTPPIHQDDQELLQDRIQAQLGLLQEKATKEDEERRRNKIKVDGELRAARYQVIKSYKVSNSLQPQGNQDNN